MKKSFIFCINTMLCAGALFAQKALQVNVRNNGAERFEQIVSQPVTEQWLLEKKFQVFEMDDRGNFLQETAAEIDKSGKQPVVTWLMPGITEAGAVRRFEFKATDKLSELNLETDLTCEERDGKIVIGTTYFQLEHPLKGHGGMPQNIRYCSSGYTDTKAHLLDRVFNRETHSQYTIMADDEATAKVVFQSPLRVVVEARTRYKAGAYSPDGLHAVYRYIYTAYSPVVDVTVDIERGDGQPIEWNELHFLHLSRQDKYYTHFVIGEPMTIIPMREKGVKGPGIGAEDWALLSTNDEAMGVSGNRLSCWDASDEFVYYVSHSRQAMSVGQKSESRSGSLYFGPASDDNEWFTR